MLVVEDDRDIRMIVTHVLTAGGYQVVPASDGEEALAHLRDGMEPCLILLDLMMPGMDGYQFRERQLKDPGFSAVPVIVCSACSQLEHRAATLTAAAYLDIEVMSHCGKLIAPPHKITSSRADPSSVIPFRR